MAEDAARRRESGEALPDHARHHLPEGDRQGAGGRRRLLRRSTRARRWAWWASPAAASRRWPAASCGCSTPPAVGHVRRAGHHQHQGRRDLMARAPQDDDGLPGSVRVAEPAQAGRLDRRRGARGAQGRHRGGDQAPRAGAAGGRGPQPGALQPLPARVLGRPAPAHRHRPRAGHPAQADRLRRAGVRARRIGAGADPEPAEAAAARVRPDLRVHRPRPRRRATTSPTAWP